MAIKKEESTTKRPPSYYRYKRNHPTVGITLTSELKDLIDETKPDEDSYTDFVKALLSKNHETMSNMRTEATREGFEEGYDTARTEFLIWLLCPICGDKIVITPNSDLHRDIIRHMENTGWRHTQCSFSYR